MIERLVGLPAKSIVVADIGAAFLGQEQVYDELIKRDLATLVCFEPDTDEAIRLRERVGPDVRIIGCALGDGGRHTMNLGKTGHGMSSLLKPDEDYLAYFTHFSQLGEVVRQIEVDTIRLDDCIDIDKIDYLQIDIQGFELTVMKYGMKKLRECSFIQTEVSFVPLYVDQPCFGEIDAHLRSFDFMPHCFAELKKWTIAPTLRDGDPSAALNQLLEADLVYIPNIVKKNIPDVTLKKMSVIAHYCYKSYDLAARCLIQLIERGSLPPDSCAAYFSTLR